MTSLRGSSVVVLGGSSGIGLAVAQGAAGDGAQVVLAARDEARLQAAASTIPGARAHVVDVAVEAQVARLFEALPSVEHVYLAAGNMPRLLPFAEIEDQHVSEEVLSRLFAAVYVARHASKKMSRGSITFTTGASALRPPKRASLLAAGAEAVHGLMRGLAVELAPVRINTVAPGLIDTPRIDALFGPAKEKLIADRAARGVPSGPMGAASDVAEAVLHFMRNNYVTGQISVVDGGSLLV